MLSYRAKWLRRYRFLLVFKTCSVQFSEDTLTSLYAFLFMNFLISSMKVLGLYLEKGRDHFFWNFQFILINDPTIRHYIIWTTGRTSRWRINKINNCIVIFVWRKISSFGQCELDLNNFLVICAYFIRWHRFEFRRKTSDWRTKCPFSY